MAHREWCSSVFHTPCHTDSSHLGCDSPSLKIYYVSGMVQFAVIKRAKPRLANTGIDDEAQCHQGDRDRRFLLTIILAVNCPVAKVSRRR